MFPCQVAAVSLNILYPCSDNKGVHSRHAGLEFMHFHGALQDSAARDPPPRFLPGTRNKEKEIMRWIEKPNPRSSVFLIQGRTRIEKTAFMQTIAERLQTKK
jgi:hypothetical protein